MSAASMPTEKELRDQLAWELDLLLARGPFAPERLAAHSVLPLPRGPDMPLGAGEVPEICHLWRAETRVLAVRLSSSLKQRMAGYRRGHVPRAMAVLAVLNSNKVAAAALRVLLLESPGQGLPPAAVPRDARASLARPGKHAPSSRGETADAQGGKTTSATASEKDELPSGEEEAAAGISSVAGFGNDAYTPRDLKNLELLDVLPTRNSLAEALGEVCEALWRAGGYFSRPEAAAEMLERKCRYGNLSPDVWRSVNPRDYSAEAAARRSAPSGAEPARPVRRLPVPGANEPGSPDERDRALLRQIFTSICIPEEHREELADVGVNEQSRAASGAAFRRWPRTLIVRVGALLLDVLAPRQYRLAHEDGAARRARYSAITHEKLLELQRKDPPVGEPVFCQLFLERGEMRRFNMLLAGFREDASSGSSSASVPASATDTREGPQESKKKSGGNNTICILLPLGRAVGMANWFKMIMPVSMPPLYTRPWTAIEPADALALSRHYEEDPLPGETAEHVRPGAFRYEGGYVLLRSRPMIDSAPSCILTDGHADPLGDCETDHLQVLNRLGEIRWRVDPHCLKTLADLFGVAAATGPGESPVNPDEGSAGPDESSAAQGEVLSRQAMMCRQLFQIRSPHDLKVLNKYLIQARLLDSRTLASGFGLFWTMDFRGRLYPSTSFAPRSHDLLRALIVFKDHSRVSRQTLAMYLAEISRFEEAADIENWQSDARYDAVMRREKELLEIAFTGKQNLTEERLSLWLSWSDPTGPLYFHALLRSYWNTKKAEDGPVQLPFYVDAIDGGLMHLNWLMRKPVSGTEAARDNRELEAKRNECEKRLLETVTIKKMIEWLRLEKPSGATNDPDDDESQNGRVVDEVLDRLEWRKSRSYDHDFDYDLFEKLDREMRADQGAPQDEILSKQANFGERQVDMAKLQKSFRAVLDWCLVFLSKQLEAAEAGRRDAEARLRLAQRPRALTSRVAEEMTKEIRRKLEEVRGSAKGNEKKENISQLLKSLRLPLTRAQVSRSLVLKLRGASRYDIADQLARDILPYIPDLRHLNPGACLRQRDEYSRDEQKDPESPPSSDAVYSKIGEFCKTLPWMDAPQSEQAVTRNTPQVEAEQCHRDSITPEAILAVLADDLLAHFDRALRVLERPEMASIAKFSKECSGLMRAMKQRQKKIKQAFKDAKDKGVEAVLPEIRGGFPSVINWITPSGLKVVISEPVDLRNELARPIYHDLRPQVEVPVLCESPERGSRSERYRLARCSRSGRTLLPTAKQAKEAGNLSSRTGKPLTPDQREQLELAQYDWKWPVEYRLLSHLWHGLVASHTVWLMKRLASEYAERTVMPLEDAFGIRPDMYNGKWPADDEYGEYRDEEDFRERIDRLTAEFYADLDLREVLRDLYYQSWNGYRILSDAFGESAAPCRLSPGGDADIDKELPSHFPSPPDKPATGASVGSGFDDLAF